MNSQKPALPWFYILLDIIGTLFLVAGVLALTGTDFGYPVLRTVAPVFLVVGILFMAPLVVWLIGRARSG